MTSLSWPLLLLALLAMARPALEQALGGGARQIAWAHTRAGRVAYEAGDCPCGTMLAAHAEALPDLAKLFERILRQSFLKTSRVYSKYSRALTFENLCQARGPCRGRRQRVRFAAAGASGARGRARGKHLAKSSNSDFLAAY